jgi:hypothetical protein
VGCRTFCATYLWFSPLHTSLPLHCTERGQETHVSYIDMGLYTKKGLLNESVCRINNQ